MRAERLAVLVCLSIGFGSGCGVQPPPVSGRYELTIRTQSDSCDPPRASGVFPEHFVDAADGGVDITVPLDPGPIDGWPAGGWVRRELSLEGPALVGNLQLCEGRVRLNQFFDVVGFDEHSLDVRTSESWNGPATCEQNWIGVPRSDCSAVRDLHYELSEACAQPCEFWREKPTEPWTCTCP